MRHIKKESCRKATTKKYFLFFGETINAVFKRNAKNTGFDKIFEINRPYIDKHFLAYISKNFSIK